MGIYYNKKARKNELGASSCQSLKITIWAWHQPNGGLIILLLLFTQRICFILLKQDSTKSSNSVSPLKQTTDHFEALFGCQLTECLLATLGGPDGTLDAGVGFLEAGRQANSQGGKDNGKPLKCSVGRGRE